jgi:hypothetical protein
MFKKRKKKAQAAVSAEVLAAVAPVAPVAPVAEDFVMPKDCTFGTYQAIYRCIDCKWELNDRQRKMSNGVCPHCKLDSRHPYCATEEGTYIPILKHFMGFLTRRVGFQKRWGMHSASTTVWLRR